MNRTFLFAAAWFLLLSSGAFAQDSFNDAPKPKQTRPAQQQANSQPEQSQQTGETRAANIDPQSAAELEDYGVAPTARLHAGAMHGPTPASIPGGQVITTKGLVELMQGGQTPYLLLDILGGQEIIPGAVFAVPAHQAGTFNDQTQAEFGGFLQQMTGGDRETPLVLYCQSTQCWMSYNAALRAINMGYTNVLWYRGGIEAWKAAGQRTTYPQ